MTLPAQPLVNPDTVRLRVTVDGTELDLPVVTTLRRDTVHVAHLPGPVDHESAGTSNSVVTRPMEVRTHGSEDPHDGLHRPLPSHMGACRRRGASGVLVALLVAVATAVAATHVALAPPSTAVRPHCSSTPSSSGSTGTFTPSASTARLARR
ncbi:MAG: hypothetical protein R2695_21515 [Acidimicrobiales bacterium]